jgi:hypothetical protein
MTEQPEATEPAAAVTVPAGLPPLTDQENAYLGRLLARQAANAAGPDAVQMKVEPPHESFTYGGVTVGNEFTSVPALLAGPVLESAGEAGVTITQET